MIFTWMPVLFTFMLASFPAGLVIYWAWNNTLSVTQQYFIMRRYGAEVDLLGNIRSTFGWAKPGDKGRTAAAPVVAEADVADGAAEAETDGGTDADQAMADAAVAQPVKSKKARSRQRNKQPNRRVQG
jgi:membrane protein insertase Oxa1/YidC/SpoIIIJ